MLDIRFIRENPGLAKAKLSTRGRSLDAEVDAVMKCDTDCRLARTRLQFLRTERRRLSRQVEKLRRQGGEEELRQVEATAQTLGEEISTLNSLTTQLGLHQKDLLLQLPNFPAEAVPYGAGALDNLTLRSWGSPETGAREDHISIGRRLGLFDFDRATKISGSGFLCLTGAGARLERSLLNFLLDLHTMQHGYREVNTPSLVHRECMVGTGQLPKFEEDMYAISGDKSSLFLAPTAEVPVTNLFRDEVLSISHLPLCLAAYTPCFRREAGSAGHDTRGMIRLHQFDKVELVKICEVGNSEQELQSLTTDVEKVLQLLNLPYRTVELCAGDLGFSASRTYDVEVWSPGQKSFLEVSSCSNFRDFQSRRMNLRYKDYGGKIRFAHTLNGSGTALPRLYVALLENHVQSDGSVLLPQSLRGYFRADCIEPVS
ncbi:MAG: serine--tRNA ligase [Candidatus Xiphinematobacter sp.]|nr:MAG: serine--tRNA ligase [Candidatus Xiphinematobacter sp.]